MPDLAHLRRPIAILAAVAAVAAVAVLARRLAARSRAAEPTRDELYERAKQLEIEGRSKMNKEQLRRAVEDAEGG